MKRSHFVLFFAAALLIVIAVTGRTLFKAEQLKERQDNASSTLQTILSTGEQSNVRPAPGNQIRVLCQDAYGLSLLTSLDESHEFFSFDPGSRDYILIWNGPSSWGQTLFTDGLTAGLPSQIRLKSAQIENDVAVFRFTASADKDDQPEVLEYFALQPGMQYEVRIKVADLAGEDLTDIWKEGAPIRKRGTNPDLQQSPAGDRLKASPEE